MNTPFALYGFQENGADGVVHLFAETVHVVKIGIAEPVQHGSESPLDLGLRGGRHAAKGPPVEGIVGGDNAIALPFLPAGGFPSPETGQLDQPLVGLRPAVAEKDPSGTGLLTEAPGQLALLRHMEKVADVGQMPQLRAYPPHPFRMGMADGVDRDPAHEIQITAVLRIPDNASLPADQGHRGGTIILQDVSLVQGRNLFRGDFSGCDGTHD